MLLTVLYGKHVPTYKADVCASILFVGFAVFLLISVLAVLFKVGPVVNLATKETCTRYTSINNNVTAIVLWLRYS